MNNIAEQLEKLSEVFIKANKIKKAIIMMPDVDGFKVYEIDEEIGKHALCSQELRNKANNKQNE